MWRTGLHALGVLLVIELTLGDLDSTFQSCCSLGRAKALDPLKCDAKTAAPSITDIPADQQNFCLSTIDLCCIQFLRDTSCKHGKQAAKSNATCTRQQTTDSEISFKYCCEACKLGMISGSMAMNCESKAIHFGSPWDEIYSSCCVDTTLGKHNDTGGPLTNFNNICDAYPGELCAHICVGIPASSSYRCQCRPGFSLMADGKSCQEDRYEDKCKKFNPCQQNCFDNGNSILCSCREGFELQYDNRTCGDTDECALGLNNCRARGMICVNTIGSYYCGSISSTNRIYPSKDNCQVGYKFDAVKRGCLDIDECKEGSHTCRKDLEKCENLLGGFKCVPQEQGPVTGPKDCIPGYRLDSRRNNCVDVDECVGSPCHSNEICENTIGSYRCSCAIGFQRDLVFGACVDINECQQNSHNCDVASQRCDNTIGSFHCVRSTGCGTGYTFNSYTGTCEDDNECLLGSDNCRLSGMECRNTLGSFRCVKKQCDSSNCTGVIRVACPPGFENSGNSTCVDINECKRASACQPGLKCINTFGSYNCVPQIVCRDGLRLNDKATHCEDMNECVEQPGICDHICINTWGSFVCDCKPGFSLHQDNRSCVDLNECEIHKSRNLCADTCVNVPGSYQCICPDGYNLMADGASCQDIDECAVPNKCTDPNEVCVNTRGSYRCPSIVCPSNYVRDPNKKNRCTRAGYYCQYESEECLRVPQSYSFNFLSFTSDIAIPPAGSLDLFTLRLMQYNVSSFNFTLELKSARAPVGIPRVTDDYFSLKRLSWNSVVVMLQKSIVGPQDIELQLKTTFSAGGVHSGFTISHLFIFISQYKF